MLETAEAHLVIPEATIKIICFSYVHLSSVHLSLSPNQLFNIMWQRTYSITTNQATAAALWDVQADVTNWPALGDDLEWTRIDGPAQVGKDFFLKPKGGPKVRLTVVRFDRATAFTDLSHLPWCKMTFAHTFTEVPEGVRIDMDLRLKGPLTFLWKKVIGEKQAADFPAHAKALIAAAKKP
jgi:hypothetical protein